VARSAQQPSTRKVQSPACGYTVMHTG
jgi:hypothetical protein